MGKVETFFRVFPVLDRIQDLAMMLMAVAGVRSGKIKLPEQDKPVTEEGISFSTQGRELTVSEIVKEIRNALEDEHVSQLEDERVERIGKAARQYKRAKTKKRLGEIYDELALAAELEGVIDELAVDAFGYWGCHFFRVAIQYCDVNDRVMKRSPMRGLVPESGQQPYKMFGGLRATLPRKSDVHVDSGTFSVSVGDRPPCVLKNTISFDLFEYLFSHCNRLVDVLDVVEHVEESRGRALNIDSFAAWKCRLLKELRNGGYPDLAKGIAQDFRRIGLFLQR